jgi:hypothetical protein
MITYQKHRRRLNLRATMKENDKITKALYQWFRSQDIEIDAAALAMIHMLAGYALVKNRKHPKVHVNRISKLMIMLAREMKHLSS